MDEVTLPAPEPVDTDMPETVAHEEVPADAPILAVKAPPVQELGPVFTLVALLTGIGLTRVLTHLGEKQLMFGLLLKPFIPWVAFIVALFARTALAVFFEQEFSPDLITEALLAGAGAVSSHAGVRSLSKHAPPLIDTFVTLTGKR